MRWALIELWRQRRRGRKLRPFHFTGADDIGSEIGPGEGEHEGCGGRPSRASVKCILSCPSSVGRGGSSPFRRRSSIADTRTRHQILESVFRFCMRTLDSGHQSRSPEPSAHAHSRNMHCVGDQGVPDSPSMTFRLPFVRL